MKKTINGLMYAGQTDTAEILGLERHTIKAWQERYDLPVVEDDQYRLCCVPLYLHFSMAKEAFKDRHKFPHDNAALIIAISHILGEEDVNQTIKLIEKGFNLPKQKATLIIGQACEWVRTNTKAENHINI